MDGVGGEDRATQGKVSQRTPRAVWQAGAKATVGSGARSVFEEPNRAVGVAGVVGGGGCRAKAGDALDSGQGVGRYGVDWVRARMGL